MSGRWGGESAGQAFLRSSLGAHHLLPSPHRQRDSCLTSLYLQKGLSPHIAIRGQKAGEAVAFHTCWGDLSSLGLAYFSVVTFSWIKCVT